MTSRAMGGSDEPFRRAVRPYRNGDATALVELFHAAYEGYGGYVERSEEHWNWCILERPGVEPDNILLVVDERDQALAYGVLSRGGKVLELAVTPDRPHQQRRELAATLLEALEQRGRAMGLDMIEANLPTVDQPLREATEAAGYRMEPMESLQLVIVDVVALLRALLQGRGSDLAGLGEGALVLELSPGRCRFLSHDRVLIRPGTPVIVEPAPPGMRGRVHVSIDLSSLMEIVFRSPDPDEVIRSGVARVAREHRPEARALLSALMVSEPWYIPLADGR